MKRILEVKKQIGTLSKNAKNPFFKSQYLDLNDLLNHVEPILWEHNLLLLQPIINNKVHSIIIDCETNQVLTESFMELPPITDPQKMGSAITYYRRYTLKSLLSIAEKDDDGNKASEPEPKKKTKLTEQGFDYLIKTGTIDEIQQAIVHRIMSETLRQLLRDRLKRLQDGND